MRNVVKCLTVSALSLGASMAIEGAALADGYVRGYGPAPAFIGSRAIAYDLT
jgi:hypothetical protein